MGVTSVVFLLLVVVATSFAQKKCCFPDQFEILDGQVVGTVQSGKGVALVESIQMAFDYSNKQAGLLTSIVAESQVYNYQIIVDFNKGVEYIIAPATKTCQKIPMPGTNMTHCVPEDATYVSSYYIGDNKMTADTFSFPVSEADVEGKAVLSVSKGDCVPVGVTFIGTQAGTPVLQVSGFVNYTSGIKDPSKYFTVPSYCPTAFSNKPKMYNSFFNKIFA